MWWEVMTVYWAAAACPTAIKCIRSRAGCNNSSTNGKQMDAIDRRQCLILKRIVDGQTKSCIGSCWLRQIYRELHMAHSTNRPASTFHCESIITKLGSCFCRSSWRAPTIFHLTRTTHPHRCFQWCTTFHLRSTPSMIHHSWVTSCLESKTWLGLSIQMFSQFTNHFQFNSMQINSVFLMHFISLFIYSENDTDWLGSKLHVFR